MYVAFIEWHCLMTLNGFCSECVILCLSNIVLNVNTSKSNSFLFQNFEFMEYHYSFTYLMKSQLKLMFLHLILFICTQACKRLFYYVQYVQY